MLTTDTVGDYNEVDLHCKLCRLHRVIREYYRDRLKTRLCSMQLSVSERLLTCSVFVILSFPGRFQMTLRLIKCYVHDVMICNTQRVCPGGVTCT
jgi:hypothetical protein